MKYLVTGTRSEEVEDDFVEVKETVGEFEGDISLNFEGVVSFGDEETLFCADGFWFDIRGGKRIYDPDTKSYATISITPVV